MTVLDGRRSVSQRLKREGYVFFLARSPLAPITTIARGSFFTKKKKKIIECVKVRAAAAAAAAAALYYYNCLGISRRRTLCHCSA